jgi:predicted small lipoprotein YifL
MRLIGLTIFLLSVTTCGQMGPLYLPDEPQQPAQAGYAPDFYSTPLRIGGSP